MKEILSDDEKQQKSWMEVQKASKESASPFKANRAPKVKKVALSQESQTSRTQ